MYVCTLSFLQKHKTTTPMKSRAKSESESDMDDAEPEEEEEEPVRHRGRESIKRQLDDSRHSKHHQQDTTRTRRSGSHHMSSHSSRDKNASSRDRVCDALDIIELESRSDDA
jgi:hypothetical protein